MQILQRRRKRAWSWETKASELPRTLFVCLTLIMCVGFLKTRSLLNVGSCLRFKRWRKLVTVFSFALISVNGARRGAIRVICHGFTRFASGIVDFVTAPKPSMGSLRLDFGGPLPGAFPRPALQSRMRTKTYANNLYHVDPPSPPL